MIEVRKGGQSQRRGAIALGDSLTLDNDSDGLPRIGDALLLRMPDGVRIRQLVLDSEGGVVSRPWGASFPPSSTGGGATVTVSRGASVTAMVGGGGAANVSTQE